MLSPRAFSVRINRARQHPQILAYQSAHTLLQGCLSIVEPDHENCILCLSGPYIRSVARISQLLHQASRHHPAPTTLCLSDIRPFLLYPNPLPPFVVGARRSLEWCTIPSYAVSAFYKSLYRSLARRSPNPG